MKKLILTLIILLSSSAVFSQKQLDRVDTCTFYSGVPLVPGDSTRWFDLGGRYAMIYVIVADTDGVAGTHYIDSIKCFAITKRLNSTDSVMVQLTMRNTTAGIYADYGASSVTGANTEYLLVDGYIDKLYLVWSSVQFIVGRRCKITLKMVARY